jgi:hypothetical protein
LEGRVCLQVVEDGGGDADELVDLLGVRLSMNRRNTFWA